MDEVVCGEKVLEVPIVVDYSDVMLLSDVMADDERTGFQGGELTIVFTAKSFCS